MQNIACENGGIHTLVEDRSAHNSSVVLSLPLAAFSRCCAGFLCRTLPDDTFIAIAAARRT